MLNNVDLNRLRVFAQVYRLQSIRATARVLNLTPSAISQSLKLLEKELNIRLFQRISKRMIPTMEADSLFLVTNDFADRLEECLKNKGQNSIFGHLRIGAPAEFGSRQVVKLIEKFNKNEGTRFSIQYALPDRLLALLADGKIDLAFCDSGPFLKNYKKVAAWNPVFTEEAVLVCSRRFYDEHVRGNHSFSHLSTLSHLDYREDARVLALWYRHHFGKVPKQLKVKLVANSVSAMISAANGSLGLAFVPSHLIKSNRRELRVISIVKTEYKNPIMLVRMKDKVPSLLEKRFVALCSEISG